MTDFFEHIDDYVAGRLTDKALEAFEAAMYADQDLRAAVENYDVAEEVMGLMIEEDVRGVMAGLEGGESNQVPEVVTMPKRSGRMMYYAAASLLILFTSYMAMNIFIKGQFSHQAVLEEYYIPPANPYTTRSETFNGPPLEEAMYFFDLRRFDECKTKFEELLTTSEDQEELSTIHFYLGNIAYIVNDIDYAKSHFSKTTDNRKYEYLGQIYYLEGNVSGLKSLYESHPSPELEKLLLETNSWKYKWAK